MLSRSLRQHHTLRTYFHRDTKHMLLTRVPPRKWCPSATPFSRMPPHVPHTQHLHDYHGFSFRLAQPFLIYARRTSSLLTQQKKNCRTSLRMSPLSVLIRIVFPFEVILLDLNEAHLRLVLRAPTQFIYSLFINDVADMMPNRRMGVWDEGMIDQSLGARVYGKGWTPSEYTSVMVKRCESKSGCWRFFFCLLAHNHRLSLNDAAAATTTTSEFIVFHPKGWLYMYINMYIVGVFEHGLKCEIKHVCYCGMCDCVFILERVFEDRVCWVNQFSCRLNWSPTVNWVPNGFS